MIMKKRTGFESLLVRRVAKKADYLRYAAYEMGLEQLRRKRVARMRTSNDLLDLVLSECILISLNCRLRITTWAGNVIGLCARAQTIPHI